MAELGRRIQEYLGQRGWTQADLVRNAKVSAPWVSRVISGEHKTPSHQMLNKVAQALGVTVDDLTGASGPFTEEEEAEFARLDAEFKHVAFALGRKHRNFRTDAERREYLRTLKFFAGEEYYEPIEDEP